MNLPSPADARAFVTSRRREPQSASATRKGALQDSEDDRWPHLVCKTFDAVITADRELASVASLLRVRSSNYQRVRSFVALADLWAPAVTQRARERLYRIHQLPFADEGVAFLSFGSGSTVFRLRSRTPEGKPRDLVLKAYRRSLGRRLSTQLQQLDEYRARYETVCRWYSGASLIVKSQFVILHGPLLGRPVVACLQPYISGENQDFFDPMVQQELPELLRENPSLKLQFQVLVRRTLEVARTQQRCVDLVGRDNLLLVRDGSVPHLQLIDYGVLDFARIRTSHPRLLASANERLSLLRELYERIVGEPATPLPLVEEVP